MVWKTKASPAPQKEGAKEQKTLKRVRHVLLAEDEDDLAAHLAGLLSRSNYRVVTVSRIREAVEKIDNEAFDLLLLDFRLRDGEVARFVGHLRMRPKSLNGRTPIVLMSGGLDENLLFSMLGMIQDALVKPFDPGQLILRIELAIERHHREIQMRRRRHVSEGLLPRSSGKRVA